MEMLTVKAWKGTPMKFGGGKSHGYSKPQVVPPATAFFHHSIKWQLRVVLAGVVRPGCLRPSSDCPHLQKSFKNWLVPTSPFSIPMHGGKRQWLLTDSRRRSPAPTPGLPSLCFAMRTWASISPNKIHLMGTPLVMFLWPLLQGQSKLFSSNPTSAHSFPNYPTAFPSTIPKPPANIYLQNTEQLWLCRLWTCKIFFSISLFKTRSQYLGSRILESFIPCYFLWFKNISAVTDIESQIAMRSKQCLEFFPTSSYQKWRACSL